MFARDQRIAFLENDNRLLQETLASSRHLFAQESKAALASSQAQLRIGEASLLASAAALASSKAETEVGLASLLVSAAALEHWTFNRTHIQRL